MSSQVSTAKTPQTGEGAVDEEEQAAGQRGAGVAACRGRLRGCGRRGLSVPARNDRDWLPDLSKSPVAAFDGSKVTVRNVRVDRGRQGEGRDVIGLPAVLPSVRGVLCRG